MFCLRSVHRRTHHWHWDLFVGPSACHILCFRFRRSSSGRHSLRLGIYIAGVSRRAVDSYPSIEAWACSLPSCKVHSISGRGRDMPEFPQNSEAPKIEDPTPNWPKSPRHRKLGTAQCSSRTAQPGSGGRGHREPNSRFYPAPASQKVRSEYCEARESTSSLFPNR